MKVRLNAVAGGSRSNGAPGLFQASVLSSDLTDRQNFAFRAIVIPSDPGVLVLWPPVPDADANTFMDHHLVANLPRAHKGYPEMPGNVKRLGRLQSKPYILELLAFELAHKVRSCDYTTGLHPVTLLTAPQIVRKTIL